MYVPLLAQYILHHSFPGNFTVGWSTCTFCLALLQECLEGIAIGNPLLSWAYKLLSRIPYLYNHAILDDE